MKISLFKVLLCVKDIVRLLNSYIESRSVNSENGRKISQAERSRNMKNAYAVLESIVLLITK